MRSPLSPSDNRSIHRGAWMLCLWAVAALAAAAEPEITVITPEPARLGETLELSGTVTARRQAMLSTRMDGLVHSIAVDAGDRVEAGTVLLRLDTALAKRELALAQAAKAEAEVSATETSRLVEEARRLRDDNFIPASELASRRAAQAAASAALSAAEAQEQLIAEQLQRHELPAPFAGVIAERMTETGEWINRGTPVFRLVAPERVWIEVNIPQAHFRRVSAGTPVRIRPDSARDASLDGTVVALVPVSDVQARAFLARIVADDSDNALFPGTSVTAVITPDNDGSAGLLLPREAVLMHPDGGRSVFTVADDNRVQRHRVHIAQETAGSVVIHDALPAGARVALRGNQLLRDGDRVTVVDDGQR